MVRPFTEVSGDEMAAKIDRILTFMEAADEKSKEWHLTVQKYIS